MMLATGLRTAKQNHVKVTFGGQLMVDALIRIDEYADPVRIDYFSLCGQSKGQVQLGILQWVGQEACMIMAAPGQPRPTDFACVAGSGYTLSRWRPKTTQGG